MTTPKGTSHLIRGIFSLNFRAPYYSFFFSHHRLCSRISNYLLINRFKESVDRVVENAVSDLDGNNVGTGRLFDDRLDSADSHRVTTRLTESVPYHNRSGATWKEWQDLNMIFMLDVKVVKLITNQISSKMTSNVE